MKQRYRVKDIKHPIRGGFLMRYHIQKRHWLLGYLTIGKGFVRRFKAAEVCARLNQSNL